MAKLNPLHVIAVGVGWRHAVRALLMVMVNWVVR
jgi:hypothetical protein